MKKSIFEDLRGLGVNPGLYQSIQLQDPIYTENGSKTFAELFDQNTSPEAQKNQNGVVARDELGNIAIYKDNTYLITQSEPLMELLVEKGGYDHGKMFVLDGNDHANIKKRKEWERVKENSYNLELNDFEKQKYIFSKQQAVSAWLNQDMTHFEQRRAAMFTQGRS